MGSAGCVGDGAAPDDEDVSSTSSELGGAPATELALLNGWTHAPYGTQNAAVSLVSGIVHFTGAIANGTNAVAFTLPAGLRPAANVYVPVDLCNATKGRLLIQPTGVVSVQSEGAFTNAQCFTSLDGAAFALDTSGFATLALENGWLHAPYGTAAAGVALIDGIVRFKGAMASGSSAVAFTLPIDLRPATNVYVPVDLCNATKGRLLIQPTGVVSVQASSFVNAQCFTSLDGASFARGADGFTPLALQNGWSDTPYGTATVGAQEIGGIVHLKGAIANGTSTMIFNLPAAFWPAANVYVPVDLCNATKGRLLIQPTGYVTIQAEGDAFANAQCFTSLEGASFALPHFTPLVLQNGWTHAPYSTTTAAVALVAGIVHFKGAIANGASALAFTLPPGLRPASMVYVPVDLCDATKGRLSIQPTGDVYVQAAGAAFANAQCFTSLEGASFAPSTFGFSPLSLYNGWTHAPYSTSSAAAQNIGGIVHLKGAIANGTSALAFTLPPGFRPDTTVYVPVDLCNATKGRLSIQPSGDVYVQAEGGAFGNAQCFTSLDGAWFAASASGFTILALSSGWSHAPYGTSLAAVENIGGIVHFKGAISNGASALVFTLPPGLRPATMAYTPVDLCNAAKGRLIVYPSGDVYVQAEAGVFSAAQCFTSLDRASFAL